MFFFLIHRSTEAATHRSSRSSRAPRTHDTSYALVYGICVHGSIILCAALLLCVLLFSPSLLWFKLSPTHVWARTLLRFTDAFQNRTQKNRIEKKLQQFLSGLLYILLYEDRMVTIPLPIPATVFST